MKRPNGQYGQHAQYSQLGQHAKSWNLNDGQIQN